MADRTNKISQNVEGPYYVDKQCIACRLCTSDAPDNFIMTDDESTAYVYKQPENDSEREACEEAIDTCPVMLSVMMDEMWHLHKYKLFFIFKSCTNLKRSCI
jgi:ferredoxin